MLAEKMYKIAVLMACYNRKDTTIKCLASLFAQYVPESVVLSVFLVDDGSPDGTGDAVKEIYPDVTVIGGTGSLYWGGGMRLAWETAATVGDFDFYLWLNDDVDLDGRAISGLLDDYEWIRTNQGVEALISGCVCCPETHKTTYSGNNHGVVLDANGTPQRVMHNNGNVVLIPKAIHATIGNISKEFLHKLGDGDYGMRCKKAGFGCYVSSHRVGTCEPNRKAVWYDPKLPIRTRLRLLHSPAGMLPNERFIFCLRHEGLLQAVVAVTKLYASAVLPKLYFAVKRQAGATNRGLADERGDCQGQDP
jgi:glycosyltransferase involved in cell wall biosynthesis